MALLFFIASLTFWVSVSNGASIFANFDLWVLEEVQKFMGVWRENRREKEEGGKGRTMSNGGEGEELWNPRVHLSLVEAVRCRQEGRNGWGRGFMGLFYYFFKLIILIF
ncbi:hypothetical protein D8674_014171 [Pyrus ussuriensis x Pyrus communis]|uniref:Transmembrane protein n=1 Tax=Pyrus ussuriensis x Pyrus communis TaxID=2448454 RepID=A0A5N5GX69_9ROSA|nr:hypothetical protein D8674_014171 [Pyrus ussuriensis x Pyrus communis]